FNLDKNIDLAAPDVQAAINAASAQLPQDLPYAPYYKKVNPTQTAILFYVLKSKTIPLSDLYDYANSVIGERLSIIEGVSQVSVYGQPYAVRVQVDPQKLATKNLGLDEVGSAIQQSNVYLPVGTLYSKNREYTINVDGQIIDADKYNPVVLKTKDGAIVRVSDIGKAFTSLQNDKNPVKQFTATDDQFCIGLGILKQDTANTLDVIKSINEALPSLRNQLPSSVELKKIYDESIFINESVEDVEHTILIALVLVVLIIFLYLGKIIDTIIPAIAIPISILGTFSVMHFMNFNIDILSLLAISLSIGFLVDDAIVVLENIVRHIEEGLTPFEAAITGSREIFSTIISMTLSLCTVFIPLIFMEGIVGRLFHEFSITIASTVLISGFVSLSLTPLLCSKFIPVRKQGQKKNKIEQLSERLNEFLLKLYKPSLTWALNHRKTMLCVGGISLGLSVYLVAVLPKDFMPGDDIGLIQGFALTTDGTSPYQVAKDMDTLAKIAVQNPYVDSIVTIGSQPQDNQGVMYICLKPFSERPFAGYVALDLMKSMNSIPGVMVFMKPMPLINLQAGTTASRADYQYTLQSFSADSLFKYVPIMQQKMQQTPGLSSVTSDLDVHQPQVNLEILRDKASMLGITAQQIENVVSLAYANTNLSPINAPLNQYYVIMEVMPKFYEDPSMLSQIWITPPGTNNSVPLSSIVKITQGLGPLTVNRFNGLPSATISFNLNNTSLSQAITSIENLARDTLPPDITGTVQGSANVFQQSFATLPFLIVIMMFIIYVILGILYENFFPPLTVMSTLPPAALGGLLTLMIFGLTLSLYAVIGLILLLGIVLKNGIIMVDFANERRELEKMSIYDSIYKSCVIRFRPILMTTLSAIMGAVPIAMGLGGMTALSRRPLGMVIIGGLIVSQILTLYLTPVIYTYIEEFHTSLNNWHEKRKLKTAE
ncbi:MAG: efflux RND transporter permease subunit, partial [Chlamydiae bacterium]|nr:efflux RND transporter permease subunit [Chlamydiota bacterium]